MFFETDLNVCTLMRPTHFGRVRATKGPTERRGRALTEKKSDSRLSKQKTIYPLGGFRPDLSNPASP